MITHDSGQEPSEPLVTADEAQRRARKILTYGPPNNPRAILQAENSLRAHWQVVRQRKLANIDPDLLAVLLLMQYTQPELFLRLFSDPLLFFYLHALATNRRNMHVGETEIEELYDLGLPHNTGNIPVEEFEDFRHTAELTPLFNTIDLPTNLDDGQLLLYLTLTQPSGADVERTIRSQSDSSWMALTSGNPLRVRAVTGRFGPNLVIPLLGQIENLISRLAKKDQQGSDLLSLLDEKEKEIIQVNKVLFAFGRVSFGAVWDQTTIKMIDSLLNLASHLPISLQLRTVYALGHIATDRERGVNHVAAEALVEIVAKDEIAAAVRGHAIRMLQAYPGGS